MGSLIRIVVNKSRVLGGGGLEQPTGGINCGCIGKRDLSQYLPPVIYVMSFLLPGRPVEAKISLMCWATQLEPGFGKPERLGPKVMAGKMVGCVGLQSFQPVAVVPLEWRWMVILMPVSVVPKIEFVDAYFFDS